MSERDELVARLRNPLGAGITPTLWLNRAADQIERDGREIEKLKLQNIKLRNAVEALGAGLDHLNLVLGPMNVVALAALNGSKQ